MDDDLVRQLIRHRLQDGRLPSDRVVQVWEMPGNGHACDGCGLPLARNQTSVCGIAARYSMSIHFHADCFVIWECERLQSFLQVVTDPMRSPPCKSPSPHAVTTAHGAVAKVVIGDVRV